MRADNTIHLKKAAATRHENTRQQAINALDQLQRAGAAITGAPAMGIGAPTVVWQHVVCGSR